VRALRCHPVEIGGQVKGITMHPGGIPALLVGEKNNVGLAWFPYRGFFDYPSS
jgi:hypothetical protein